MRLLSCPLFESDSNAQFSIHQGDLTDLLHDVVRLFGVEECEDGEDHAGQSTDNADADCPPDKVHTNQTEGSHLISVFSSGHLLYLLITNQESQSSHSSHIIGHSAGYHNISLLRSAKYFLSLGSILLETFPWSVLMIKVD